MWICTCWDFGVVTIYTDRMLTDMLVKRRQRKPNLSDSTSLMTGVILQLFHFSIRLIYFLPLILIKMFSHEKRGVKAVQVNLSHARNKKKQNNTTSFNLANGDATTTMVNGERFQDTYFSLFLDKQRVS